MKRTKRAIGGIAYDSIRNKYKVTYKGIFIGRYNTEKEAQDALDVYIRTKASPTFENIYNQWYSDILDDITTKQNKTIHEVEQSSAFKGYRASFNACKSIKHLPILEIPFEELQAIVDTKNYQMRRKMKTTLCYIYNYAAKQNHIKVYENRAYFLKTKADEAI